MKMAKAIAVRVVRWNGERLSHQRFMRIRRPGRLRDDWMSVAKSSAFVYLDAGSGGRRG